MFAIQNWTASYYLLKTLPYTLTSCDVMQTKNGTRLRLVRLELKQARQASASKISRFKSNIDENWEARRIEVITSPVRYIDL